MAEKKEEATAAATLPEPKKYIAKENCFYNGTYLKRGAIIVLNEVPNHACLVPYKGTGDKEDTGFFDPMREYTEQKRILAAMPGFMN